MDNWWRPDPPGTINPAKLLKGIGAAPDTSKALDKLCVPANAPTAPEPARQSVSPATPARMIPRSTVPPLLRISSDWDPEQDIIARRNLRHQDIRKEFEDCHVAKRPTAAARVRHNSHRGHFRSQTENGEKIRVPVDTMAGPDGTVVVDRVTASIYDAYLLRADTTKNVNLFRRHQVRQHTRIYINKSEIANKNLINR